MLLVNDVRLRSLDCPRTPDALFQHVDAAPSLKPFVMAGVRGMSHVLIQSDVTPPQRR
ncbi:hypothetical protein [Mycobacterium ostraviense]|uniref:hypothetical protein n=1 Tax=Mycobacterium ostraviense TaxID=2738409 RepID=UPI000AFEEDA5|nr:hypothetical protein [Mycobacterium ostraviense]